MTIAYTRDTVLRRATDVQVNIDATNSVTIPLADGQTMTCGPHALTLLEAFASPRRVDEALRAYATTAQDWIDLTSTLDGMIRGGVLFDPASTDRPPEASTYPFDWPNQHISMLNDRARTAAYLAGIAEAVRPGDVVVDIGTGTGVLAAAAARAGARRVYAVEAGSIADSAAAVFADNGLSDTVTLLRGWSTRLEVPEPADLVISEIIGKEPLDERVLETVADVRRRWLKPGGRLLPQRLRILGTPVTVPPDVVERFRFTSQGVGRWREWYGIDFRALVRQQPAMPPLYIKTSEARHWPRLAPPVCLAEIDFATVAGTRIDHSEILVAAVDGTVDGMLLHFDLQLTTGVQLSTDPAQAPDSNSWRHALFLVPPVTISAGERLTARYRHRVGGAPSGVQIIRTGDR